MLNKNISVRQAHIDDHERIVDYFLSADKDFLVGMGVVDMAKLPQRQGLDILRSNVELSIE